MSVENIRVALADHETLLTFEDVGDYIKIQPKQFLTKEKWDAVNILVREWRGSWVSLGKESHWKVPKTTAQPKPSEVKPNDARLTLVHEAIDLMEKALTRLREAGY